MAGWRRSRRRKRVRFWRTLLLAILVAVPVLGVGLLIALAD
jgi:hypothetical protein